MVNYHPKTDGDCTESSFNQEILLKQLSVLDQISV